MCWLGRGMRFLDVDRFVLELVWTMSAYTRDGHVWGGVGFEVGGRHTEISRGTLSDFAISLQRDNTTKVENRIIKKSS